MRSNLQVVKQDIDLYPQNVVGLHSTITGYAIAAPKSVFVDGALLSLSIGSLAVGGDFDLPSKPKGRVTSTSTQENQPN